MKTKKYGIGIICFLRRLSVNRESANIVRLNSIWLMTAVVTLATLSMFWLEFFLPQLHVGLTRSFIYYALLTFYVVYKEINRWLGQHQEKRIGSAWVIVWWSSVFLMETISFGYQEYYRPLAEQYAVAVAVSVNFLISWTSKCLYQKKTGKNR